MYIILKDIILSKFFTFLLAEILNNECHIYQANKITNLIYFSN